MVELGRSHLPLYRANLPSTEEDEEEIEEALVGVTEGMPGPASNEVDEGFSLSTPARFLFGAGV